VALRTIAGEARAAGVPDWSEAEWSAAMSRVRSEASGDAPGPASRRAAEGGWRWVPASALGAAVGLALLFVLLGGPGRERPAPSGAGTGLVSEAKPQDVLTMTLVSPETGLQIVWFFDKDFDYKGEQE
jgi:hypothetical protein